MKNLILTLLSALILVGVANAQYVWSWQYPMPQGNTLHAVQCLDSNTVFAVGMDATFIKSVNSGEDWVIQNSIAGSASTLRAIHFHDASTGYVVGDGGLILRTADGGSTWTPVPSGVSNTLYGVAFGNSMRGVIVGSSGKILVTTNGGLNWTAKLSGTTNQLFGVSMPDSMTATAVGSSGIVLRSIDGGDTWVSQTSGINLPLYSVSFWNASIGMAVGNGSMIIHTTNGGMTWDPEVEYPPGTPLFGVAFADSDVVVAVGQLQFPDEGIGLTFRTTDGGATWNNSGISITSGMRSISFLTSSKAIAVGYYGSIVQTPDAGLTWTSLSSNSLPDLFAVAMHEDIGFAVGRSSTIIRTTDGGSHWTVASSPTFYNLNSISSPDGLTATAVGDAGTIVRSTDSGATWALQPSGTSNYLRSVSFTSGGIGTAVGDFGTILRTTDGGLNWIAQASGLSGNLYGVAFSDSSIGTIVGAGGTILTTTNGGNSWVARLSGTSADLYSITYASPATAFAVGQSGTILRTTTGGVSWIPRFSGTAATLRGVSFGNASKGRIVGPGGLVLMSTDGGAAWSIQSTPTLNNLFGISYIGTKVWIAGEGASILKLNDLIVTGHYSYSPRWNLVSLPMDVSDARKSVLFPTAISSALMNTESGYAPRDTLERGTGYWLKFPGIQNVSISGTVFDEETVHVHEGWNLIGAISDSVPVSAVVLTSQDLIGSLFYTYNGGYVPGTSLIPGRGYWIRALDSGTIILASGVSAIQKKNTMLSAASLMDHSSLTITDKDGNQQVLYFGVRTNAFHEDELYRMPPRPGEGIFDVRFGSDKILEEVDPSFSRLLPIIVSSATYPVTISWNLSPQLPLAGTIVIDGKERPMIAGTSVTIHDSSPISIRLEPGLSTILPAQFALHQNYPNPFNPATQIRYDLVAEARVSLKVFNLLGQEIKTLVDEFQGAGYKTVEWRAIDEASGVYFYKLTAMPVDNHSQAYTETRRLMLLK